MYHTTPNTATFQLRKMLRIAVPEWHSSFIFLETRFLLKLEKLERCKQQKILRTHKNGADCMCVPEDVSVLQYGVIGFGDVVWFDVFIFSCDHSRCTVCLYKQEISGTTSMTRSFAKTFLKLERCVMKQRAQFPTSPGFRTTRDYNTWTVHNRDHVRESQLVLTEPPTHNIL